MVGGSLGGGKKPYRKGEGTMLRASRGSGHDAATAPRVGRVAAAMLIAVAVVFGCTRAWADPGSPLTVTKSASSNPVASGAQLTYTVVIKNTGGAAVSNVVMTDQVNGIGVIQAPPALPQLIMTSTKGSCVQGGPNGNLVTCNVGGMAGGETVTITIRGQVTAGAGTTLNNTASVTATKSSQNFTTLSNATATLVTSGSGGGLPDLTINKTGPTSVAPSAPITYTLTVNNIGAANATGVKVVDTVPAGITGIGATGSSLFSCGVVSSTVTCTGGAVNQGQNATITITGTAPASGTLTNTAVVDPDNSIAETNELNNTSASVNTTVGGPPPAPLLAILKTDNPAAYPWSAGAGPDPVNPGQKVTYKIQVKNNATGTNSRADDVVTTDSTQGLDASSITASQTIVNGTVGTTGGCVVSAPQVRCSIKSLNAGGTQTVTIAGTVLQSAGSSIFDTATVTGNIKNQGVSNTASEVTTVRPLYDLTITKDDLGSDPVCARSWPKDGSHLSSKPDNLSPGASGTPSPLIAPPACLGGLTYQLEIGNSGTGTATNVEFTDSLPSGAIFDSYQNVDGGGFGCKLNPGNVIDCTGGTIGPNSTKHVNVLLVAPPGVGVVTNQVAVDPNNTIFEADETNNTATQTTTVTTGIDLAVWKGDSPTEDPPGDAPADTAGFDPIATSGTGTYNIIVENLGTQDSTGIKVRDTLPAGTKFLSATTDPVHGFTCTHDGSPTGGNVTCIGGHLLGTEAEFYTPPGGSPVPTGHQWATITIKFSASPFVQPAMHNEVRVDPDNEIAEANELNNLATDNTVVGTGDADKGAFIQLKITKTQTSPVPPTAVATNGTLIYNLHVENAGTDPVSNVVVKDFLPTGSRFISAADTAVNTDPAKFFCTHDGSATGGVITCTAGDFSGSVNPIPGVGTHRDIKVTIFAPDVPGTYTNHATVDPDNVVPEGNEFDNDSAVDTTVTVGGANGFADLQVSKTGPASVLPGATITYDLTVTNTGTNPAFNVKLRDDLPDHTTFVSAVDTTSENAGAFSCSVVGASILCTGGTLDGTTDVIPAVPGPDVPATRTIQIKVLAPASISQFVSDQSNISLDIFNRAIVDPDNTVPESNETNNTSQNVKTTISPAINLTLDKQGPGSATQNQPTTYTITVTNNKVPSSGPGAVAQGVKIVDPLPVGLIPLNVEADPGNFACSLTENPVNSVTCIGDLNPGDTVTITITAFVTLESGTLDNEACVDPDNTIAESNEIDNCKHAISGVTPQAPDLQINKSADKGSVTSGEELTYTLNVSNVGTGDTTSTVTVIDDVPSQVTVQQITPDGGWDCTTSSTGNHVECTRPSMAAGDSSNIVIRTTAGSTLTAPFTNGADVSGGGDTQSNNNHSEVTTLVGPAAVDLKVVSISDNPDPVNRSSQLTYQSVVNNLGTSGVTGAIVRVELPDMGVSSGAVAATNGFNCSANTTVDPSGNTFDCTGDFGASGTPTDSTTITATMTVTPSAPNDLTLVVTADPDNAVAESDETTTSNTKSETTTVSGTVCTSTPCVDLVAADIFDNPDPVKTSDGSIIYTGSIVNVGDSPVDPTAIWNIDITYTGPGSPVLSGIPDLTQCAVVPSAPPVHHVRCTSKASGTDWMDFGPGAGLTFTVTVTGASTAGTATLKLELDQTSPAIAEFDEGNNVLTETTTITT
jgi:uncharacterized repeat protein (TIGR01451 family)